VVPLFYPGDVLFFIIGTDEADEIVGLGIAGMAVYLVGFAVGRDTEKPRV
jgi:hypothetical protein